MRLCEPRFAMWLALVKVWLTAITVNRLSVSRGI
jgi:hypothetical protein